MLTEFGDKMVERSLLNIKKAKLFWRQIVNHLTDDGDKKEYFKRRLKKIQGIHDIKIATELVDKFNIGIRHISEPSFYFPHPMKGYLEIISKDACIRSIRHIDPKDADYIRDSDDDSDLFGDVSDSSDSDLEEEVKICRKKTATDSDEELEIPRRKMTPSDNVDDDDVDDDAEQNPNVQKKSDHGKHFYVIPALQK